LLFRRYEKDRRCRFNALLDKLGTMLPNFAESTNIQDDQKLTKAQIVENSIKFIKLLQKKSSGGDSLGSNNESGDSSKLLKLLKKQNKKLRDILRSEFAPKMSEKEFCTIDFGHLQRLIKEKKDLREAEAHKENNGDALNDAGDVFVVSTDTNNGSSDHTYSLIVQAEAEVEIGSETEDDVVVVSNIIKEVEEVVEVPVTTLTTSENLQPIIIQMAAPQNMFQTSSIPTVIPFQTAPLRLDTMPPNKLPLPRTYSMTTSTAGLVNVYSNPVVVSQPWRLPKEKRRRNKIKKPKTVVVAVKPVVATAAAATSSSSSVTSTPASSAKSQVDSSDFVHVSASTSLPKAILATEDPDMVEKEQEVIDLTVEVQVKEKVEVVVAAAAAAATTTKKSDHHHHQQDVVNNPGGKKTKSSYSIAALCQMSVNIGGDPSAGVPDNLPAAGVNSPGVVSLNSCTESPRATPTPQSPRPSSSSSTSTLLTSVKTSSSSSTSQHQAILASSSKTSTKKVIQELKSVNDSCINKSVAITDDSQPNSPTKSYLTQFPVVKSQQQQQQNSIVVQPVEQPSKIPEISKPKESVQPSAPNVVKSRGEEPVKTVVATTSSSKVVLTSSEKEKNGPPKHANYSQLYSSSSSTGVPVTSSSSGFTYPNFQHSQSRQIPDYTGGSNVVHHHHQHPYQTPYPSISAMTSTDFSTSSRQATASYTQAMTASSAAASSKTVLPQMHAYCVNKKDERGMAVSSMSMPMHPGAHAANIFQPLMQQAEQQHQQQIMQQQPGYQVLDPHQVDQGGNFFSVNQLVSHHHPHHPHKGQFAQVSSQNSSTKKPVKRSSASSSSSRYQKQPRIIETTNKETVMKKDDRKAASKSQSSRSTSSGGAGSRGGTGSRSAKRSYTAESLLSSHNELQQPQQLNQQNQQQRSYSSSSSSRSTAASDKTASNRMVEYNWNVGPADAPGAGGHFAPFPSISPSPNLFSQEFGSFDFPTSMFPDMHAGPNSTPSTPKSQGGGSSSRKEAAGGGNRSFGGGQQISLQSQQDFNQQPGGGPSDSGQQGIFDGNFFPIPTLTPPASSSLNQPSDVDSSGVTYVNFSTANIAMCHVPYNQVATSSTPVGTGAGGRSSHVSYTGKVRQQQQQQQQQQHQQQHQQLNEHQLHHHHQHQQHQQQQQLLQQQQQQQQQHQGYASQSGGSSYVNFNLSTIFPEINVGPPTVADKQLALLPNVPPPTSSRISSSTTVLPTLPPPPTSSSADFRGPIPSSNILPHSIAILGHGSHQMAGFGSVPFSAANFSSSSSSSIPPTPTSNTINFTINDQ
jgi:hypothetical protein